MTLNQRQQLGIEGEKRAAELLSQKKFQILARNLRTRLGEIDILARDGQALVIVEVKTKQNQRFGSPGEMITLAKQRKLIMLALELQLRYQTERVRIDLVTVDATKRPAYQLAHYQGVIEYHG